MNMHMYKKALDLFIFIFVLGLNEARSCEYNLMDDTLKQNKPFVYKVLPLF